MRKFLGKSLHHPCNRSLRHFHMKQDAVGTSILECLTLGQIGVGETNRAVGKVEDVAVPMESFEPIGRICEQDVGRRARFRLDWIPADFFAGTWAHLCAERSRQQLTPEADSYDWQARLYRGLDESKLLQQERVLGALVNAHRPAHHDQRVSTVQIAGDGFIKIAANHADGQVSCGKRVRKTSGTLTLGVL